LVQPGHVFPLQAVDGGVLMRAGHTEAGCDLVGMAGCSPSSVICEIMKDDGTMARLPDLQLFAAEHGLKIGTIADLIEYRSRNESLVERVGSREIRTPHGDFTVHAFRDKPSQSVHLALVKGQWGPDAEVPVRVHEPLSVLDALELNRSMHSWSLDTSLQYLEPAGSGRGRAAQLRRVCRAAAGPVRRQRPPGAGPRARPHGPAHLWHRRADSAPVRCAQNETHGQPAPHAQHDRLRPRNHRLHPEGI